MHLYDNLSLEIAVESIVKLQDMHVYVRVNKKQLKQVTS